MSNSKKHPNYASPSQQNKKSHNNDNDLLLEEPQWIDIGNNKTSFVWKYFGLKTDGRAYCRYIINKRSAHKIYEEKLKQTKIDDQFKKVIPHKESKQHELQCAVTDWIIMDSQSFNAVNGLGFQKIMKKVDQNTPNNFASANQDSSNLNSSDLTSNKETDEDTIYISLKILRTINECNTQ
ncbi:16703_t:CDS:2 [Cetraspora pellucida]|uniref:16703_t:CDS:1 n=1 Tax=Cetraspora pellucida TaxID=1433469 RepID=A0ACA9KLP4_9GLOM|nr:16703_t:CDS:2 [Cetraspora pellucida]